MNWCFFLSIQRALQSFMLYSQQSRDPHTVRWMEEYGDMVDMLQFHGTGAFNMTRWEKWDSFLLVRFCQGEALVYLSLIAKLLFQRIWHKSHRQKSSYVRREGDGVRVGGVKKILILRRDLWSTRWMLTHLV